MTATPKPVPVGKLVDQLDAAREKKRRAAEALKALEAEYSALEEQVKERLLAEGMLKATGTKATVSIKETVVANIIDWDALCGYIKKTGHFHLLQRRVSDPAFRELAAMSKKGVPGLAPFTKIALNHASLKAAA